MLNFYPQKVFEYFEKISSIPHGSYNTEKIADYLVAFAKDKNLDYKRDKSNNVVIFKDAAVGKEKTEPIILQGHTDMVCASEGEFDFINNSITLDTDGKFLFAKGTTLGGDNGIAVAMMLALLDLGEDMPPLECVFTSDEEVGMLGANALDMSCLRGKRMINIDSEVEGVFTIGCAGGVSCNITSQVSRHNAAHLSYKLEVSGLHGGHSGVEINSGYANGIKVACDFLSQVSKEYPVEIVSLNGGQAENAIPKSVECIFLIDGDECIDYLNSVADKITNLVKKSYNEPSVTIKISYEGACVATSLDRESSENVISLIDSLPNGVLSYDEKHDNSVKTSCNIGVVELNENLLNLKIGLRSSVNNDRDALASSINSIASLLGASCEFSGMYPAWEPKSDSYLTKKAVELYKSMYGKEPVVEVIHAGLECSVFSDRISDFDCVSIGPNLIGIHTPEEKVEISSVGRVYDYVWELLKSFNE